MEMLQAPPAEPPFAADTIFVEVAELAAQLCGAAHAAITLHRGGEHAVAASVGGLDLRRLPSDTRFCCEVLHSGAPLEVGDAQFDLRFHDDPLVAAPPRIRFYSGVPLLAERGEVIGTLSVFDGRAQVLAAVQRAALWKLADVVVRLLADIEARQAAEATLSWQATHDTLTELGNRRAFEAALRQQLEGARRHGHHHALLYIDLDQFKLVNDTCGHVAGDAMLRQLSQLLAGRVRTGDVLARLGGDEFGLVLAHCDLLQAQRIAAQLLAAIRGFRFSWEGRVFAFGASIGVAAITAASRDVESLLAAADTACYLAKDNGRNQVQVYREDDEEVSSRHGEMAWASRLTQGLEEDRLFLHCQRVVPLDPLRAGESEYLELLLRLRDESGRVVPPKAFIPAAERYQFMGTIDRWVVRRAFGCLARMGAAAGRRPRFGINLSGSSLGDLTFGDFVQEQFDATGTRPEQLCFEITETAAISNLARAGRFIQRFRDIGCRFALDDFGSGLSSFEYLKAMPVDYLKIDGSFVRGVAQDRIDHAVVEAIQRLAAASGARAIAECVENEAILSVVRSLGIDFGQGHALHVPEPYATLAGREDYARADRCSVHAA